METQLNSTDLPVTQMKSDGPMREEDEPKKSRREAILWLLGVGIVSAGAGIPLLKELQEYLGNSPQALTKIATTTPTETYTTNTTQTGTKTITQTTTTSFNDASQIIAQALANRQTKIHLPAGQYSVSAQILITKPNVEIYGDNSSSTVLRLNDNVLLDMFSFKSANNFYVHDLQIDGNRQNQPYTPPTPHYEEPVNISGIDAWNSSNGLIENCFIHDCRTFGILYSKCTACQIRKNYIQNCDANGITVDNASGGSGCTVNGNTIDGASDVGITGSDAVDYTVRNNVIKNIIMNSSPFEQNTNLGLCCEARAAGCKNCTYQDNIISNILVGAYIGNVQGLKFNENIINAITYTHNNYTPYPVPFAINVDKTTSDVDIEDNIIENLPHKMQTPIVQLLSPSGIFKNNLIFANGGRIPIYVPNSGWKLIGNKIM